MAGRAELERTVAELREHGVQAHAIEADVTRARGLRAHDARGHRPCSGVSTSSSRTPAARRAHGRGSSTEADWDFVHEVCLKSVFLTTRAVVPHMIERHAGTIVLTASRNGLRVEHGYAHYNAAKAGVIHYGKSLALELGPYEVDVNIVCPTQMADKSQARPANPEAQKYWDQVTGRAGATYEEFDAASGRDNLFERSGQPDYREVAEGVLWLVSDRARLVTGLALPMDAGWVIKRGG